MCSPTWPRLRRVRSTSLPSLRVAPCANGDGFFRHFDGANGFADRDDHVASGFAVGGARQHSNRQVEPHRNSGALPRGQQHPVKNVRVRFDLNGDANSIGGTLAAGSNIVYPTPGVAITNYSPGERSSPTNGLTVRACWDYADFSQGSCPNQVLATLTVVADPLSITIGTDNTASEGADKLTYTKKYILLVVDSAGQPKSDVQLTPSLDLDRFAKGFYTWNAVDQVWSRPSR